MGKLPPLYHEVVTNTLILITLLVKLGVAASRSKILILGVSYKKDLGDYRESPALEVIHLLQEDDAAVCYHDPFVPGFAEHGLEMESTPLSEDLLNSCDLVIITADHSSINYDWLAEKARHILDTRNATRRVTANREKITLL